MVSLPWATVCCPYLPHTLSCFPSYLRLESRWAGKWLLRLWNRMVLIVDSLMSTFIEITPKSFYSHSHFSGRLRSCAFGVSGVGLVCFHKRPLLCHCLKCLLWSLGTKVISRRRSVWKCSFIALVALLLLQVELQSVEERWVREVPTCPAAGSLSQQRSSGQKWFLLIQRHLPVSLLETSFRENFYFTDHHFYLFTEKDKYVFTKSCFVRCLLCPPLSLSRWEGCLAFVLKKQLFSKTI